MFQALRRHLRYSNVAATMALVFALTGGALAASSHGGEGSSPVKTSASTGRAASFTADVSKKSKKKAPSTGKPGPRGPAGPAGPAGPQGAASAKGETGVAGANGNNGGEGKEGKAGVSVTSEVAGSECKAGGTKFTSASGTSHVCNGENGQSGFTETLPAGKTETGQFVLTLPLHTGNGTELATEEGENVYTALSFSIPLPTTVVPHFIGTHEELAGETNENPAIKNGECAGSPAKPEAAKGDLCVFAKILQSFTFSSFLDAGTLSNSATGTTGEAAGFRVKYEEPVPGFMVPPQALGTWAVTAE